MLGAMAGTTTGPQGSTGSARATGRHPRVSDNGPTPTADSSHAASVAVPRCRDGDIQL